MANLLNHTVFLSGPGGVGKSHVIKLIQSDTIKFLKQSGAFEPNDVMVILAAELLHLTLVV